MAAPSDWITTTRQALPRFFELVSKIRPDFHLDDVRAIDSGFIEEHGIEALLWDVDGTLMSHHDMGVAPDFQATLKEVDKRTGIRQAILSNCGETRFAELGRIFPEVPVLKAYTAPDGKIILRTLLGGIERWVSGKGGEDIEIAGLREQLRPLKKPSGDLIELTLGWLGSPQRDRTFMVGDQYFTDIAGANLAGIRSIKVPTFQPESFPLAVRSFQMLERLIYRLMH